MIRKQTPVSTGFTSTEQRILKRLHTPANIQDFLESFPFNFEPQSDTCFSPRRVMQERRAHCIEGAMFAAAALRFHGQRPLLLDLTAAKHDFDHVVALFRQHGCWGALSKTNHAVLRYREPVYRTVRELVLSYFHEYFDARGQKTLRSYAGPIDLTRFDRLHWMTKEEDVWEIPEYLCDVPHRLIVSSAQRKTLRRADAVERRAGEIVQWRR